MDRIPYFVFCPAFWHGGKKNALKVKRYQDSVTKLTLLSHIGDNIGYKKNVELCNRNLNNKHMAKDAEIEQVLSLSKEKCRE